jgi:hypothetical protein
MRMLSSFGDRILNMGARGRLTVIVPYSYDYESRKTTGGTNKDMYITAHIRR